MTPAPPELKQTAITPREWIPGYEILTVVGTGGFGTVVRARQLKLDRVVAIKIVQLDHVANPALARRFDAEAFTLGKFHHPNIVPVFDYGYHDGRMFIVMELLEGEDLGRRLQRVGKLDELIAWAIARQTASALAHAAAHGVVHRDVKPSNLFLTPAPTGVGLPRDVPLVKVTDFGLALTKWEINSDGRLTDPGMVLGTPVYMAPEQYRGSYQLDHRLDIYGLGATVYHALAGKPPFQGATIWKLMANKLEHPTPSWPAVSRGSVALLSAMMAPDPRQRIGTYEELIDRIERLTQTLGSVAPAPRPTRWACEVPVRRWWPMIAAAGALAAAGVTIGLSMKPVYPPAAATRYVSRGNQEALFDSQTMTGWLPPAAGGFWHIDADDEKTIVLTGTGFTRRSFLPSDDYRVTIGLDIHTASEAEVHVALPEAASDAGRRFVLRVSKTDGATFGTKDGDQGTFEPLGKSVPFPSAAWFEGRRPYLEVRFQRAGGAWSVWFNGALTGRALDDDLSKRAELRLFAVGGQARVDSVILERLAPPRQ